MEIKSYKKQILAPFSAFLALLLVFSIINNTTTKTHDIRNKASSSVITPKYPNIQYHPGPYGISPVIDGIERTYELDDARAAGFDLIRTRYRDSSTADNINFLQKLDNNNQHYISTNIWAIINAACQPYAHTDCFLDSTSADWVAIKNDILNKTKDFLLLTKDDPRIVGYWILDDYRGVMKETLKSINILIKQSESQKDIKRPSLCGFGGALDYRDDLTSAFKNYDTHLPTIYNNFSPEGCDIVAPYPYGYSHYSSDDPRTIDWSMARLLPAIKSVLTANGWDIKVTPIIGVTQTFGKEKPWVAGGFNLIMPDYNAVVTQTKAYCSGGATSILFYSWDDASTYTDKQLVFNNADLRKGIIDGVNACKTIWGVDTANYKYLGDLNNDKTINILDLSILSTYWATTNSTGDINNDGNVSITDLSIMATNWGKFF